MDKKHLPFPEDKTIHNKNKQCLPGVDLVTTNLDAVDELDLGQGFVLLLQGRRGRVHLGEGLLNVVDLIVFSLLVSVEVIK